jgi:hypothetical protein
MNQHLRPYLSSMTSKYHKMKRKTIVAGKKNTTVFFFQVYCQSQLRFNV